MPVGRFARGPAPDAGALAALPLVGAVIGGLAGALGLVAAQFFPRDLAAAVALGAIVVLTGALHVDGFLDGCDAFIASVGPERRIEILKDPRHGTFAVAGMFVAGSLWLAALAALPPQTYPATLAFAAALARAAALPNARAFPYAPGGRPGAAFASRPPALPILVTLAVLACAAYALAPPLLALVPASLVASRLLANWIARRLGGGLVGDAYGFIIVILEVGILATIAAGTVASGG